MKSYKSGVSDNIYEEQQSGRPSHVHTRLHIHIHTRTHVHTRTHALEHFEGLTPEHLTRLNSLTA